MQTDPSHSSPPPHPGGAPLPYYGAPNAPYGAPPPPAIQEIHLRDLLAVLYRFRWSAVSVFMAVFVATAALTFSLPRKYEGVVRIAIQPSDPDVQLDRPVSLLTGKDTFFETQIAVLKSWPVYEETLKELGLEDEPLVEPFPPMVWLGSLIRTLKGAEAEPPTLRARVKAFMDLVSVRPGRDSDVVTITVRAGSPELAQTLANALAEFFSDVNLRHKREKSSGDRRYLAERLASTKGDLIDAERELRRFEDEKDTISLEKRIEHLSTLRIEKEGELSDVERQIKEVSAQLRPLLQQLSSARKGVAQATAEAYAGLQQKLLDLRLRRSSLLKAYTPEHPEVLSVEEELAIVESKVNQAESALLAGESGSVSGMDRVVSGYNERVQELEVLRAREASLKQLLDHYQKRLKEHLALKSQYDFLQREVEANKKVYDLLLIRQKEAALKEDMQISDVRIIEPALLPDRPSSPRVSLNLVLGVILGGVLGCLAAYFRGYMDRTVHDGRKLEAELGVPCLAWLPETPSGEQGVEADRQALGDAVTRLGLSAELGTPEDPAHVILITSAAPGEGKTTVASQLALAFAQGGERTLLLDCDLRKPRQAGLFGLAEDAPTVTDLLEELPDELAPLEAYPRLTVVAEQSPVEHPEQVIGQADFARCLMTLRDRYTRIVVDSPPVNVVADALHLAQLTDRVVLVARSEVSSVPAVERAARSLEEVRCRVAGTVMNAISARSAGYYNYSYGYGYYGYGGGGYGGPSRGAPGPSPSPGAGHGQAPGRS